MCDNRTVTNDPEFTQGDLSRRIALGREEAGLTQAELAGAIEIDRTAVAKIESGSRKVSGTELVRIAAALDRSIDWFVVDPPVAVISRRADPSVGGRAARLDARVDRIGRDVDYLVSESVLPRRERTTLPVPTSVGAAEQLADSARQLMGLDDGPVIDLQSACETAGLLAFSLDLGDAGGDAAYIAVDGWGVAVVNGAGSPGRRRFNLAHELGHHLIGDAYAAEVTIGLGDETERIINAFAAHFLMPRRGVIALWEKFADRDRRLAAVAVATRFRVSWTAALGHLRNLGLLETSEHDQFASDPPRGGDFVELGERWVPELEPPSLPPDYGRRVIRSYRSAKLTRSRTVELLWDTVSESELPDLEGVPIDALRREFDPMQ